MEKGMVEVTAKKAFLAGQDGFIRTGQKLIVSKTRASALTKRGLVSITQRPGPTEFKPAGPEEAKPDFPEEEKEIPFSLKFECADCEGRFDSAEELDDHDCYVCEYCNRTFETPQGVAAHQRFCKKKGGN